MSETELAELLADITRRRRARRPRGVYALALLLLLCGAVWLLAALLLPITGTNIVGGSTVPWYLYALYAAYFLTVGWGLWSRRRWAYIAALLMCVVLAFYQVQSAVVLRQNALIPFLLLAAIFGYLLLPNVRAAFLRSEEPPAEPPDTMPR